MNFRLNIPVRWADIDGYQHVNNSVYLRYFEEVRWQWYEKALGFKQWAEENQLQFIVAVQSATYKRPITYPNMVSIKQKVLDITKASFTLHYEVSLMNDDSIYCTGEVKLVCFDPKTRKAYKMPDKIKMILENSAGEL